MRVEVVKTVDPKDNREVTRIDFINDNPNGPCVRMDIKDSMITVQDITSGKPQLKYDVFSFSGAFKTAVNFLNKSRSY